MSWLKSLHFKHTLSLSLTERTCDTRTKIRTRAREREGETRYVAGTHCPRNHQLDGMARSPSMDPQIWSASSKSFPFLASTQSNTVRGGNFPVRFDTIDSLNFVLCFFCLAYFVVVSCVQADAFLLAIAGGPDLLARIQTRYFEKSKSHVARVGFNDKCSATNCNNVFNKERSGTPQTSSVPRSSPFFPLMPEFNLTTLEKQRPAATSPTIKTMTPRFILA